MSKSKDLAKSRIPKEIRELLGEPVLMRFEKPDEFEEYLVAVAAAVGATSILSWQYCADVTYQTWDIRRLRYIRSGILIESQINVVTGLMRSTYDDDDGIPSTLYSVTGAESDARKWSVDAEFGTKIDERLAARGHDRNSVLADAYSDCVSQLTEIDKRISDLEFRRIRSLREISRLDAEMAKRLDKASSQIIEGEFTQAAE